VYSQRALVEPTGLFTLFVQPGLKTLDPIIVRATPRDSAALVPSKDFEVPFTTSLTSPLELGEYDDGGPILLSGRLVDGAGNPVSGAAAWLEGEARGGGTFTAPAVTTDPQGRFSLQTLRPSPGTQLTLWAVPMPRSIAGIVRKLVDLPAVGGDFGDVLAPAKADVKGRILRPGGDDDQTPAMGVIVEAVPVAPIQDRPFPPGITRAVTDAEGRFALRLDPAMYRLDFAPTDLLPRVSRFATVSAVLEPTDQLQPLLLPDFRLSRGRSVTGTVSSIPQRLSTLAPVPAPYASVKFFRVVNLDGRLSSMLLAETVADESGQYSVVLPTGEGGDR